MENNPYNPITEPASHKWWTDKQEKLEAKTFTAVDATHTDVEALAEKESIEALATIFNKHRTEYGSTDFNEVYAAMLEHGRVMYTAALSKNEGWVRVSDRLPKAETKVLVVVSFNGFTEVRTDTYRIVDSYGNEKNWFHYHNVTHWQPLPEAPKQ